MADIQPPALTGNLLFDVLNATTSGDDKTPPSATLVWIMLANRARSGKAWPSVETLSKGTRLAQSTVKACLRGLVHNGRIKAVGWFGKGGHASRVYEVYAVSGPWTEPHQRQCDPDSRPSVMADERPGPVIGPQVADERTAGSRLPDIRQPVVGYKPPSDPLRDPPKEPPSPPAQARASLPLPQGGQQSLPLSTSPRTTTGETTATTTPLPKSGVRKAKAAPGEPRAEDLYAEAYLAGHAKAGYPMTPLQPSDRKRLGMIAGTHARRHGVALVGDELLRWIRVTARAFRRSGWKTFTVFAFGTWLDAGAPGSEDPDEPPLELPELAEDQRIPRLKPPPRLTPEHRDALFLEYGVPLIRTPMPKGAAHG